MSARALEPLHALLLDSMMIKRFEDQVRANPRATALVIEDGRRFSYAELDGLAHIVALHIEAVSSRMNIDMGENDTPLVCIMMSRDVGVVAGILGILKAAAAYVPVDPAFPPDRQSYIFKHSRCHLAIMDEEQFEKSKAMGVELPPTIVVSVTTAAIVPSLSASTPLPLSSELEANLRRKREEASARVNGGLGYVLYTSGSTGNPKGVAVKQEGVVNIINWFAKELDTKVGVKVLGLTTFCFDISVLEMFMPLLHGATLVLAFSSTQKDPFRLLDIINEQRVDVLQATPTTYEMMLATGWTGDPLLDLLVGGEAFRPSLLPMVANSKSVRNVYGPTETTIWSSSFTLPKDFASSSNNSIIPIGEPISETDFYLASEADVKVLAGPGQEGELCIGGVGVARGYLHAPDLTEGRFIPNPYPGGKGRVYRTGDLVKLLPDGCNYVFVRRIDDQVKIDGFRIELAEIENVYAQHARVDKAVVLVRNGRLAVYLMAAGAVAFTNQELEDVRVQAAKKLMYYMMPKDTVVVNSFPVTPNGKLDKKQLPDPPPSTSSSSSFGGEGSSSSDLSEGDVQTELSTATTSSTSLLNANKRGRGAAGRRIKKSSRTKQKSRTMLDHISDAVLKLRGRRMSPKASFSSIGVDSLGAVLFIKYLSDSLGGIRIEPAQVYKSGVTLESFSTDIVARLEKEKPGLLQEMKLVKLEDIAEEEAEEEEDKDKEAEGGDDEGFDVEKGNDEEVVEEEEEDASFEWEKLHEQQFEQAISNNRLLGDGLRGLFAFLVLWEHFHALTTDMSTTFVADTSLFVVYSGFTTVFQWREGPQYRYRVVKTSDATTEKKKRYLVKRGPFRWKTFLLSRCVGIFPTLWVSLIINAPGWYWSDYYWKLYHPNPPTTGDNSYTPGFPEQRKAAGICSALYVIGMNSWYRPQCRGTGPNTVLYASIILNDFIMYAIARVLLRCFQDYVCEWNRHSMEVLSEVEEDEIEAEEKVKASEEAAAAPAPLPRRRFGPWCKWFSALMTRVSFNRPKDWTEALFIAFGWFLVSSALLSSLLTSSMKNGLSFLPDFILGASAANVAECFHYARFVARREAQMHLEEKKEEEKRAKESVAAVVEEEGLALASFPSTQQQKQQQHQQQNEDRYVAAPFVFSQERILAFLWRFTPDIIAICTGFLMSTITHDLDYSDGATILMYLGIPVVYMAFGVVALLQEGNDRINGSRLFIESWPLTLLGYVSYPLYLYQQVGLNAWRPMLQHYFYTGNWVWMYPTLDLGHYTNDIDPFNSPYVTDQGMTIINFPNLAWYWQMVCILCLVFLCWLSQYFIQDTLVARAYAYFYMSQSNSKSWVTRFKEACCCVRTSQNTSPEHEQDKRKGEKSEKNIVLVGSAT